MSNHDSLLYSWNVILTGGKFEADHRGDGNIRKRLSDLLHANKEEKWKVHYSSSPSMDVLRGAKKISYAITLHFHSCCLLIVFIDWRRYYSNVTFAYGGRLPNITGPPIEEPPPEKVSVRTSSGIPQEP